MFRLRMNCSELNYHLFNNHVSDNPSCSCGSVETSQHYFLECPLHYVSRAEFVSKLANINVQPCLNTILYGKIPENLITKLTNAVESFFYMIVNDLPYYRII